MISFRQATVEDLDTLVEIEQACFHDPWNDSMLKEELSVKDSTYVLMLLDDVVVGYYSYMHVIDEVHIMNVAILPPYQGQGLGKIMMRHLLDGVPADTVGITLEVRDGNKRAIALYEGCGFVLAGKRPGYYLDKEDARIYWLKKE